MTRDNYNKGTIAKNERKTEDKHPDIAGSLNVDGKDFWINGWLKTNSRDGSKFYSLSVKPKQERAQEIRREASRQQSYAEQSGGADDADSIPF
jgi:hypothetical protein